MNTFTLPNLSIPKYIPYIQRPRIRFLIRLILTISGLGLALSIRKVERVFSFISVRDIWDCTAFCSGNWSIVCEQLRFKGLKPEMAMIQDADVKEEYKSVRYG